MLTAQGVHRFPLPPPQARFSTKSERPLLLPPEMRWLLVSHTCSCHRAVSLKAIGLLQPPDCDPNPKPTDISVAAAIPIIEIAFHCAQHYCELKCVQRIHWQLLSRTFFAGEQRHSLPDVGWVSYSSITLQVSKQRFSTLTVRMSIPRASLLLHRTSLQLSSGSR